MHPKRPVLQGLVVSHPGMGGRKAANHVCCGGPSEARDVLCIVLLLA